MIYELEPNNYDKLTTDKELQKRTSRKLIDFNGISTRRGI